MSSGLVRTRSPQLRRMALFDAVINNADRKGGHLLPVDGANHIFGIDHGISFHNEDKLRTLLWGWRRPQAVPVGTRGAGAAALRR